MNLSQLTYINQTVLESFNMSAAAKVLRTSQPAISKQIQQLENELQVEIFTRNKNRLTGLTARGQELFELVQGVVHDLAKIREIGRDKEEQAGGRLRLAITHTQARYVFPGVIKSFVEQNPSIQISIRHGSQPKIDQLIASGESDVGITTTEPSNDREIVALPCRTYDRVVIVPKGHPLLGIKRLSFEHLQRYPFITYEPGYGSRASIANSFRRAGVEPHFSLSASDGDVIKRCVEQGLGISVLSEAIIDAARDKDLRTIPAKHLFGAATTFLLLQKRRFFRKYEYSFFRLCAPRWSRANVEKFMRRSQA